MRQKVEAIWTGEEAGAQASLARTDGSGKFTLHGIDPIAELSLTAWDGFAGSPVVTIQPQATARRPTTLTLSAKHTTPVGGQVLDTAGKPIAGASVRICREVQDKSRRVILVEPATGKELFSADGHMGGVQALAWSPDGKRLATAGAGDGSVIMWDTAEGKPLRRLPALEPGFATTDLHFAADGKALLSYGSDRPCRRNS